MSVDALQERIRKRKCALVVDLTVLPGALPPEFGEMPFPEGYRGYVSALLKGLKGMVPGVRFRVSAFALLGAEALAVLPELTRQASELGYYVLMEAPELGSRELAELAAQRLEVGRIIDAVPDVLTRSVLRWRFLNGLTWKETAERAELTDTWTFKLWGRVRKAWREAEQAGNS